MSTVPPTVNPCDVVAIRREFGQRLRRRAPVMALLISVFGGVLATPAASAATANRVERKIVQLVNRERAKQGLPSVHLSRRLVGAARFHSAEMLRYDYFDHRSIHPSRAWDDRVRSYLRRSVVGETLAWGAGTWATPAQTVRMWMASPPHREILLDRRFRLVGVGRRTGVYAGSSGAMVTADFASQH